MMGSSDDVSFERECDSLCAYVDRQLGPAEEVEILNDLSNRPEMQSCLLAYERQKALLRLASEAMSPADDISPRTAALERELARRLEGSSIPTLQMVWTRARYGAAAAILIATGWIGYVQYLALPHPLPAHIEEALGAHRVFADDRAKPVETPAGRDASTDAWLAAKLGEPVRVPAAFEAYGIHLLGTRLLGTKEGPSAQFIYEDPAGRRLSLTVAAHRQEVPVSTIVTTHVDDDRVSYWSDGKLDYILTAKTGDTRLEAIASDLLLGRKASLPTGPRGAIVPEQTLVDERQPVRQP